MSRYVSMSRRRSILAAALVSAASLALVQCDRAADAPTTPDTADAPVAIPEKATPLAPQPQTALGRGDLISAAAQAASAYAEGRTPTTADPLIGRSFTVRMPFGCSGPAIPGAAEGEPGVARWSPADDNRAIQLSLTPGDWTDSALIAAPLGAREAETWEAVEGFWVPRPWMAAETCPSAPTDPLLTVEPAVSPQTLGIAAVFEAGGSRVGRRNGRAYAFSVRPAAGQTLSPPVGGYRLVLQGRIVGFPGGRAIRCKASGPDQRPVCVAAARMDRVAFEDAAGAVLTEWRAG
ncbi:hypothetical protein [Brevundimonas subvibrioides]|uniref:Secreted protein n=1 Tax=Brevundimonas subvibrioides (strain ATCC 15264 / DSM 4735 / LMG 14903 / NBRC 16000 / CB 81) TaxID=633149 RepID=D9QIN5_BRESC|nr:hypothetical protein [Brevundimonas subvibrioides]ADL01368.1 conserved hypothetical protein [Brevundimonas subvibrioides ATCC 15264]